jgi:hypothetical protein
VLEDRSGRYKPMEWAREAVRSITGTKPIASSLKNAVAVPPCA